MNERTPRKKFQYDDETGATPLSSLSRCVTSFDASTNSPVERPVSCTCTRNGVEHTLHAAIMFCFFSRQKVWPPGGSRSLVEAGSGQDMK